MTKRGLMAVLALLAAAVLPGAGVGGEFEGFAIPDPQAPAKVEKPKPAKPKSHRERPKPERSDDDGGAPTEPAGKSKTKLIGKFNAWKAFTYLENGNRVCYASSVPSETKPVASGRGDSYILVTHRPHDKTFNVVSVNLGARLMANSNVVIGSGQTRLNFFSADDAGWARDAATDFAAVEALRRGGNLVVKATSANGVAITDTYNLDGANAAISAIGDLCKEN